MAMYKLREVRFDGWGNVRPKGKRLRWYTDELPLELGGVYMIQRHYYRVERVL